MRLRPVHAGLVFAVERAAAVEIFPDLADCRRRHGVIKSLRKDILSIELLRALGKMEKESERVQ